MNFDFIPKHELNKVLNDGFYVKINKNWTATVRCLADLIQVLSSGDHEIDTEVFGVITQESSDKNAGNFYHYLLQIIGAFRGMATFNHNKHTFIELNEDRHTISVKTSKGKLLTFAVMDYADCVDIALHNSDVVEPTENGGDKPIPQFEVIGFNCGATPVKRTKVTVLTVLTK